MTGKRPSQQEIEQTVLLAEARMALAPELLEVVQTIRETQARLQLVQHLLEMGQDIPEGVNPEDRLYGVIAMAAAGVEDAIRHLSGAIE